MVNRMNHSYFIELTVIVSYFYSVLYTMIQKFGVSKIFFLQQRCTKLGKSDSKDIYNVTKHF